MAERRAQREEYFRKGEEVMLQVSYSSCSYMNFFSISLFIRPFPNPLPKTLSTYLSFEFIPVRFLAILAQRRPTGGKAIVYMDKMSNERMQFKKH